jgi:transposase
METSANPEDDRGMAAPWKYPDELRERAIRLVLDAKADPAGAGGNVCQRIGEQLGIHPKTLRGWVKQAEIDAGTRPGTTTDEATRLAELEREVRELRRANATLKSASAFFAAELCATRRGGSRGGERPSPSGRRSGLTKLGQPALGNAGLGGKRPTKA